MQNFPSYRGVEREYRGVENEHEGAKSKYLGSDVKRALATSTGRWRKVQAGA